MLFEGAIIVQPRFARTVAKLNVGPGPERVDFKVAEIAGNGNNKCTNIIIV